MGAPAVRGSGRPSPPAPSAVSGVKPGTVPTPKQAPGSMPAPAAASAATSPNRSWATNAPAPLSARM